MEKLSATSNVSYYAGSYEIRNEGKSTETNQRVNKYKKEQKKIVVVVSLRSTTITAIVFSFFPFVCFLFLIFVFIY